MRRAFESSSRHEFAFFAAPLAEELLLPPTPPRERTDRSSVDA
ncbi:hypothetical protein [Microbacterium sp. NIBRBAC000506063]|nr:hypothetical protein [Microbacterium sp. NIBRBAC000506063]